MPPPTLNLENTETLGKLKKLYQAEDISQEEHTEANQLISELHSLISNNGINDKNKETLNEILRYTPDINLNSENNIKASLNYLYLTYKIYFLDDILDSILTEKLVSRRNKKDIENIVNFLSEELTKENLNDSSSELIHILLSNIGNTDKYSAERKQILLYSLYKKINSFDNNPNIKNRGIIALESYIKNILKNISSDKKSETSNFINELFTSSDLFSKELQNKLSINHLKTSVLNLILSNRNPLVTAKLLYSMIYHTMDESLKADDMKSNRTKLIQFSFIPLLMEIINFYIDNPKYVSYQNEPVLNIIRDFSKEWDISAKELIQGIRESSIDELDNKFNKIYQKIKQANKQEANILYEKYRYLIKDFIDILNISALAKQKKSIQESKYADLFNLCIDESDQDLLAQASVFLDWKKIIDNIVSKNETNYKKKPFSYIRTYSKLLEAILASRNEKSDKSKESLVNTLRVFAFFFIKTSNLNPMGSNYNFLLLKRLLDKVLTMEFKNKENETYKITLEDIIYGKTPEDCDLIKEKIITKELQTDQNSILKSLSAEFYEDIKNKSIIEFFILNKEHNQLRIALRLTNINDAFIINENFNPFCTLFSTDINSDNIHDFEKTTLILLGYKDIIIPNAKWPELEIDFEDKDLKDKEKEKETLLQYIGKEPGYNVFSYLREYCKKQFKWEENQDDLSDEFILIQNAKLPKIEIDLREKKKDLQEQEKLLQTAEKTSKFKVLKKINPKKKRFNLDKNHEKKDDLPKTENFFLSRIFYPIISEYMMYYSDANINLYYGLKKISAMGSLELLKLAQKKDTRLTEENEPEEIINFSFIINIMNSFKENYKSYLYLAIAYSSFNLKNYKDNKNIVFRDEKSINTYQEKLISEIEEFSDIKKDFLSSKATGEETVITTPVMSEENKIKTTEDKICYIKELIDLINIFNSTQTTNETRSSNPDNIFYSVIYNILSDCLVGKDFSIFFTEDKNAKADIKQIMKDLLLENSNIKPQKSFVSYSKGEDKQDESHRFLFKAVPLFINHFKYQSYTRNKNRIYYDSPPEEIKNHEDIIRAMLSDEIKTKEAKDLIEQTRDLSYLIFLILKTIQKELIGSELVINNNLIENATPLILDGIFFINNAMQAINSRNKSLTDNNLLNTDFLSDMLILRNFPEKSLLNYNSNTQIILSKIKSLSEEENKSRIMTATCIGMVAIIMSGICSHPKIDYVSIKDKKIQTIVSQEQLKKTLIVLPNPEEDLTETFLEIYKSANPATQRIEEDILYKDKAINFSNKMKEINLLINILFTDDDSLKDLQNTARVNSFSANIIPYSRLFLKEDTVNKIFKGKKEESKDFLKKIVKMLSADLPEGKKEEDVFSLKPLRSYAKYSDNDELRNTFSEFIAEFIPEILTRLYESNLAKDRTTTNREETKLLIKNYFDENEADFFLNQDSNGDILESITTFTETIYNAVLYINYQATNLWIFNQNFLKNITPLIIDGLLFINNASEAIKKKNEKGYTITEEIDDSLLNQKGLEEIKKLTSYKQHESSNQAPALVLGNFTLLLYKDQSFATATMAFISMMVSTLCRHKATEVYKPLNQEEVVSEEEAVSEEEVVNKEETVNKEEVINEENKTPVKKASKINPKYSKILKFYKDKRKNSYLHIL